MNEQQAIPANFMADGEIDIHSMFKTIQGEGPFCGERALFIRLYGCNLQCPWCDTEYTSQYNRMTPAEIWHRVVAAYAWPRGGLIVFTGGEPFRQNVLPTIFELLCAGYRVQVETNGVTVPHDIEVLNYASSVYRGNFTIVCSPKTSRISPEIGARASAFKYVLRAGEVADDGLPTRALGHPASPHVARPRKGAPVYVQPMDEQDETRNVANLAAAMDSCTTHGYTLQLQIHKIIGVA